MEHHLKELHRSRFFACVAVLAGAAACDPAGRIRNGMRENDVLEILGKPTRTVGNAAEFRDELTAEPRCVRSAQRVFGIQPL